MGDGAANRPLVTGLEVADERQCRSQQWKLLRQRGPGHQPVLRDRRADLDLATVLPIDLADRGELGDAGDIRRIAGSTTRS